ncbi:MAG: hypothetical protein P8Y42_08565 [Exilibacterium sp.]
MSIDSVLPRTQGLLQQGLNGMKQSHREMVTSADQIVKAGTAENGAVIDIAEPLINMRLQQHLFDASAKVVKVADENLGSLLDIRA